MDSTDDDAIDRTLLVLGRTALTLALLTGFGASWIWHQAEPATPERETVRIAKPPAVPGPPEAPPDAQPVDLRRFALNALLAPLIDDSTPPRWTDVALDHLCDPGTRVLVDEQPLIPGGPVPERAFSLRWTMNHCEPFGPVLALSGTVELTVTHEAAGMTAVVHPERLHIHTPAGRSSLQGPFGAALSLVAQGGP